jgi:hypothetical protein
MPEILDMGITHARLNLLLIWLPNFVLIMYEYIGMDKQLLIARFPCFVYHLPTSIVILTRVGKHLYHSVLRHELY